MNQFTDMARTHWTACDEAHTDCTFRYRGVTATVRVYFEEPDVYPPSGAQSKDYLIEYMHADMPQLAQGDLLTITESDGAQSRFRVRQAPRVDEQRGMDGTYRCAMLTREKARDS